MAANKQYKVIAGPIDHDGTRYETGDRIALADAVQAQALIEAGVIGQAKAEQKGTAGTKRSG